MARPALLLILLALVIGFRLLHLQEYLSFASLKAGQDALRGYQAERPGATLAGYLVIYIAVTALSLPGAAILTLAGGALFGFVKGAVVISFASTLGATLAFLLARFLFRDSIQQRFSGRLQGINEGVRKEGAFYLFALRLVPAFPFFMVNLVMALTPIRTFTFFWVSQLGMLPGTLAYVNAGTRLPQLTGPREILSPGILLSFVILGILPFVGRRSIEALRARRVLRRFKAPRSFDYNLVVIGGGAAGLVASYIAAAVKARVALIEKSRMGGDCLNTGCVPSKALIRSAKMLAWSRRAGEFGFRSAQVDFDFAEVMDQVKKVIARIEPHDSVERYAGLGVECINGEARILSPYEVRVDGRVLTTRSIVVATGASPVIPSIPGIERVSPLTSESVWSLRALPKRLLVLGGGPIGCELAQAFQRFGSQVVLVEKGTRLLNREDNEVSDFIMRRFRDEGVDLRLEHKAIRFVAENGTRALVCEHEGHESRIEFDEVLLALGRRARVKGFGLEELGVEISSDGYIVADEYLRTNYPNLFVCGDVAGPLQFTHMASHQAWHASVNALFGVFRAFKVDDRVIPRATFTDPEVARVGFNEKEAREKGITYEVTRYELDDLDRAIIDREAQGFVKVLTAPGGDKILGATIVGAHAEDILIEYVTAMKYNLGLNRILGTVHLYPSLGEANKYAAGVWKREHAPQRVLKWARRFHEWRRGATKSPSPSIEPQRRI